MARIFVIGSVLTGLAVGYIITRFTHGHMFPIILRKSIEFLGPIFIKFGQWASTRKDLFPEDICHTLSHLQKSASVHSWIYTKQLLKAIYGSNWRNIFVKFEHEMPIGSGCCAQVYKAWIDLNAKVDIAQEPQISTFIEIIEYLRFGSLITFIERIFNNNVDKIQRGNMCINRKLQPVAVKVLHPGIKKQLRRDLSIMRGICKCATFIMPKLQWLSLIDCIDEFSHIMENQVDMNLEAENLIQFSKNFSNKKEVIFPQPYKNFTQHEILVESFHEGSPISNYLDDQNTKLQGKLARMGVKTILKMVGNLVNFRFNIGIEFIDFFNYNLSSKLQVFNDNFIHCDLHPGNILVQTNYESSGKISTWFWRFIDRNYLPTYPRLVILDCGLVVSLNDRCRQNLKDVFRSVVMGKGELAAEYILEHSSHVSIDPDGFKNAIKNIVNTHLQSRTNVNF
ncbi:aarF domain-containing protein kinase 2 isoform X1 [Apis mellifera carnica]|nr:aarF domain-containing protein kinase 2 isoform X1 [Apis mellifera carnica]